MALHGVESGRPQQGVGRGVGRLGSWEGLCCPHHVAWCQAISGCPAFTEWGGGPLNRESSLRKGNIIDIVDEGSGLDRIGCGDGSRRDEVGEDGWREYWEKQVNGSIGISGMSLKPRTMEISRKPRC